MTAIMTTSPSFTKVRSRAYPPDRDHCRGFWRFGVDAPTSLRNLVSGADQLATLDGANIVFGDNYIELTATDTGINTGLVGGAEPYTMLLMCTTPAIGGADAYGQYCGFYNSGADKQAAIEYSGSTNKLFDVDYTQVGVQPWNQGGSYGLLFLTNDGSAGLFGHAASGAVVSSAYSKDPDAGAYPFRIGRGRTSAGSGSNAHTWRAHSAALFDVALDAAAIMEQMSCFSTWAEDVGLAVA